jgi:hypothetical protein
MHDIYQKLKEKKRKKTKKEERTLGGAKRWRLVSAWTYATQAVVRWEGERFSGGECGKAALAGLQQVHRLIMIIELNSFGYIPVSVKWQLEEKYG